MWHCPVPCMTSLSSAVAGGAGELPTALLPCPHHGELTGFDRPPQTPASSARCPVPLPQAPHKAHLATKPITSQPSARTITWHTQCHSIPKDPSTEVSAAASPAQPWLPSASSDGDLGPTSHCEWCLLIGTVPSTQQMPFPTSQEQINHPLLF